MKGRGKNWSSAHAPYSRHIRYCRDSPLIGYILAACTGLLITLEILLVRYNPEHLSNKNIFIALFWTYTSGTIVSLVVMVILLGLPPGGLTFWRQFDVLPCSVQTCLLRVDSLRKIEVNSLYWCQNKVNEPTFIYQWISFAREEYSFVKY